MSKQYADINLIHFLITGEKPPDITRYRNELFEYIDQVDEAYEKVKDPIKINSLNVNWKLYKLLQILDYPCRRDDFFCLKTPSKQKEHEETWYNMIEYLSKKYPGARTPNGKPRWRHITSS